MAQKLRVDFNPLGFNKTLALVKRPFCFLSDCLASLAPEFPLHCVLDTKRPMTGETHALLTTGPLEGCPLSRCGFVLAIHLSDSLVFFFFFTSNFHSGPLSLQKRGRIPVSPSYCSLPTEWRDYHNPTLPHCLSQYVQNGRIKIFSNPNSKWLSIFFPTQ